MEGDLKIRNKIGFFNNYVFIELRKQNRQERSVSVPATLDLILIQWI